MPVDGMMVAQHILDREGRAPSWHTAGLKIRYAHALYSQSRSRGAGRVEARCLSVTIAIIACSRSTDPCIWSASWPIVPRACSAHTQTLSPEAETTITMPWWVLGWEVVGWLGHRRFARHWSVQQLRTALADTYHIPLSDDAIERYIPRSRGCGTQP